MPLAFDSLSHGTIAFGFFNIESDLILLDHYFFFADEFCRSISKVAEEHDNKNYEFPWGIYWVESPWEIGNLMGAMYGVDHRGLIGAVYKRYPFPADPDDFAQKAEGFRTRGVIEPLVQQYAKGRVVSFRIDGKTQQVQIGDYVFDKSAFQALIGYVWMGGMPRWKDNIRPDYVLSLKTEIERSKSVLLKGLLLR